MLAARAEQARQAWAAADQILTASRHRRDEVNWRLRARAEAAASGPDPASPPVTPAGVIPPDRAGRCGVRRPGWPGSRGVDPDLPERAVHPGRSAARHRGRGVHGGRLGRLRRRWPGYHPRHRDGARAGRTGGGVVAPAARHGGNLCRRRTAAGAAGRLRGLVREPVRSQRPTRDPVRGLGVHRDGGRRGWIRPADSARRARFRGHPGGPADPCAVRHATAPHRRRVVDRGLLPGRVEPRHRVARHTCLLGRPSRPWRGDRAPVDRLDVRCRLVAGGRVGRAGGPGRRRHGRPGRLGRRGDPAGGRDTCPGCGADPGAGATRGGRVRRGIGNRAGRHPVRVGCLASVHDGAGGGRTGGGGGAGQRDPPGDPGLRSGSARPSRRWPPRARSPSA